jgi:hypothetical protein
MQPILYSFTRTGGSGTKPLAALTKLLPFTSPAAPHSRSGKIAAGDLSGSILPRHQVERDTHSDTHQSQHHYQSFYIIFLGFMMYLPNPTFCRPAA